MTCLAKYLVAAIASLPLCLAGCANDSSSTIDPVLTFVRPRNGGKS